MLAFASNLASSGVKDVQCSRSHEQQMYPERKGAVQQKLFLWTTYSALHGRRKTKHKDKDKAVLQSEGSNTKN